MSQLYVHQCIKNEPKNKSFGFHPTKKYKKGDYVTYEGTPTKDLQKAFISDLKEYNLERGCCKEYFKAIKVKISKL